MNKELEHREPQKTQSKDIIQENRALNSFADRRSFTFADSGIRFSQQSSFLCVLGGISVSSGSLLFFQVAGLR
jgi:hypothetical protein